MAHNIEIKNGIASYAENGKRERAWHKLGQVFDRPMTVKEALEASHADYRVELQPVVALTPEISAAMATGNVDSDLMLDAIVKGRKATMRMDNMKPLGIVSDSYGIVQNEDAFKFIDTLVTGQLTSTEHTPIIECAGVLGQGERVFMTAKFPEQIILDNKTDDRVEMYVVFTTSHDGTGSVNCMVTPTRVVCNNTLNFAMRYNAGKISLRHTTGIMGRLDLQKEENAAFAYKTLNMYNIYKTSLEEKFKTLQNIRLAEKDLDNILAEVMLEGSNLDVYRKTGNIEHEDIKARGRNIFLETKKSIESGVGQDICEAGTGMWFINGMTTYFQNAAKFRNEEAKMDSVINGRAAQKIQRAYELITS